MSASSSDVIRVLHVDDEPDFADMATTFIEREDNRFDIEIATSASEGLDLLASDNFDCVVSDYDMPGRNGIEFLEAVRDDYPDLPFILYTGKGSEEVASEAISAGVTDYLQKESGTDQYTILANRITNTVEQTRAVQEVTRTRTYFGTILEHASDYVMVVDENAEVSYISPAVKRILGYTPEDLEGTDAFEHIHPEDLAAASTAFTDVIEHPDQEHTVEYRVRHANGSWRWVEVRGRNRLDDSVIEGIIVSVRDITQRKARQQELRQKERRFQAVFNDPNILVGMLDTDGTVLDINETAMGYIDTDVEEITGEPLWDSPWFTGDETVQQKVREWIDRAAAGEYVEFELDLSASVDEELVVSGVFRPVRNDDGEVVSLLISDRDITEQKEHERQLEQYKKIVETMDDVAFVVNDAWTVEYANESILEYVDGPLDALEGHPVMGLAEEYIVEVDGPARFEQALERTFERGRTSASPERLELTLSTDDKQATFEYQLSPLVADGETSAVVITMRDITERKQQEARLQAFIEHSTDIISVLDSDGTYQYQSPSSERITGYGSEELLGETAFEYVHPDDREDVMDTFSEAVANPEMTPTVEYRFKHKDGSWLWLESIGNNQLANPAIEGFVVNSRDITERKRRMQEIETLKERLEFAVEGANLGVWDWDMTTNEVEFNEQWAEMLGYTLDELEPHLRAWESRVHPDDLDDVTAALEAHRQQQTDYYDTEHRMRTADGDWKWIRDLGRIVERDDENEPVRAVGIHLDIDEWKTRERQLEALNRVTQELMSADTREEVAEIGVETMRDLLELDANSIHLYDDDADELVPVASTDAVYDLIGEPPTFAGGDSIAWQVYQRGETLSVDDVHEEPNRYNPATSIRSELYLPLGQYGVLLAGSSSPETFDEQDALLGEILAGGLATALEQLERTEQLRARERELTNQNDRLEEFASVVSHDLQNPLNIAEGRLELAASECDSEHLEHVKHAHERMRTLIEDLLSLAREGETVTEVEPVALTPLVEGCWANVETDAATLDNTTDRSVQADESRLKQLFENLMRNAIEHCDEDVTVTVGELDGGFYIEDDGPGIPEEERDDVFEAGYSTSESGTGFGLSIVKQVVDAHGWEIHLTEGSEGGARFEITGVEFAAE